MQEKLICIVTPKKRCYFQVSPLATEFLDKDNNIIHQSGTIPDGKVEEIKIATKTVKHYKNGKLDGELAMIDLTTDQVTFTEQYENGVLIHLSDNTLQGLPIPVKVNIEAPSYEGTLLKVNKETQSFYVNGKEVAEQTVSANGTMLEQLGTIPDGPVKEFDDNGQLRMEATYKNNLPDGELLRYDEQGRVTSREHYVAGKLHGPAQYFSYILGGKSVISANYTSMQLDGEWTSSFPDGKPCISATYKNGKLHGKRITLYQNGRVNVDENFENGKMQGMRMLYYPDGRPWYQENYKDDRLDGERFCFFTNGQKFLEEFYTEGLLEGARKTYSEDGTLITSQEYHWGSLVRNTDRNALK